jgi:copper(I)-binding protein
VNRVLRAATIGTLLFTPVVLTACSAGQLNQTSTQARDKTGPQASVGDLALREVQLAYPSGGSYAPGDDAELTMVIANPGETPDQLVSVTGSDFASIRITGTGSATAPVSAGASGTAATPTGSAPAGTTSASVSAGTGATSSGTSRTGATSSGTSSTATTSGIAGATGSPTATLPSSPAAGTPETVSIPAEATVQLGRDTPHVFLQGLTRSLTPGQRLAVTFTFAKAGTVTVQVGVATPSDTIPVTSSFNFGGAEPATTSSAGQGG